MADKRGIWLKLDEGQMAELTRAALVNNCSVEQMAMRALFGRVKRMPKEREALFNELAVFGAGLRALYERVRDSGTCEAAELGKLVERAGGLMDILWEEIRPASDDDQESN